MIKGLHLHRRGRSTIIMSIFYEIDVSIQKAYLLY